MKKIFLRLTPLLSVLVFSSTLCYAQEANIIEAVQTPVNSDSTVSLAQNSVLQIADADSKIIPVGVKQPQKLIAPVVQDPKNSTTSPSPKMDLNVIMLDPNGAVEESNAEYDAATEQTFMDKMQFNLHEALHGEVSALSTKGLLEDKMRMKFKKGPIESISPWIDYSGNFSNIWAGDTYKNTTYGINFNDIGFNGKFRTKDDPASGKKTVFRLMYNVGKEVVGNTYMQSFLADNYIMRYWTKDDQVLIGYARAAVGIEGGESPFTIPFFGRSQISRTYGSVRTLGVKMQGNHKFYDYSAGYFSSGRFFRDWFPGQEFVGLASIKPLGNTNGKYGNLVMGGSMNAGNAEDHYFVTGAHLIYEYKRLKASAEYATADGSNGATGFTRNKSEGFYGTLAYRVTPKLQALVRYDQFDPNKEVANDRRTEYTAGLNYFIKGQALKLMLNYVLYSVENGTYGSRIMFGTQIIL